MSNSTSIYNQLSFDKKKATEIEQLFKQLSTGNEFEVMFYNYKADNSNTLSMQQFITLLEYVKKRSMIKKEKIVQLVTLDISYNDNMTSYRLSINGLNNIKQYVANVNERKNHVIFKIFLNKMLTGDKNIKLMKKVKTKDKIIDLDDYNTRFRISDELKASDKDINMLKNLNETAMSKIFFRYKQRVSLIVKDSTSSTLQIDLTNTKQTNNVNMMEQVPSRYELELDLSVFNKTHNVTMNDIYKETEILHKVVQQTNYIISTVTENNVLDQYRNILEITNKNLIILDGRKPLSLEIQHVVDILPNKYAVTDKADGSRYFLIIVSNKVYLIKNNLHLKYTGVELPSKLSEYNNTVLDGEYIFLPKYNRYLFMVFDCLHKGTENVKNTTSIVERLAHADEIINKCFILKGQKGFKMKEYDGKFDMKNILSFHSKQITDYMDNLDHDISHEKQFPLIRRKYFIPVTGGQSNEIFKYSELLWNKYVSDSNTKCPYILDGLIYHPIEQKYITSVKNTKYFEYKWKPEDKNSVDFYIKFEKDPDTNNDYVLFDNSYDDYIKGKPYKICNLHVGKSGKFGEQPVLFQKETNKYIAHLFLENGQVRDETGNIIKDGTVVEFYYIMDNNINEKYRWRPMRTRYDKTESVMLHKRRYGNYIDTANKVWRSIINPFTMKDISTLAKDMQYETYNDVLRNKIDHSLVMSERNENKFKMMRKNLAKSMVQFDNWMYSILLYTYCDQKYEKGKKQTVLEIGCGNGLEILKFYHTIVALYVGMDIDSEKLMSSIDGAISRYERFAKKYPNFPKMNFVQADASVPLNYENQLSALGRMSNANKTVMEKYFPSTKFDRIVSKGSIHNFLSNKTVWNNFCDNINVTLKEGGLFIITCLDGKEIHRLLYSNEKHTTYYTNESGEKKIMFELVKKYDNSEIKDNIELGIQIDYHMATILQEEVFVARNLIDKDFLIPQLADKCNLDLVETDLYFNQLHTHKDFFKDIRKFEDNPKTRDFFEGVSEFYDKTSINDACVELMKLHRYYVFRKRNKTSKTSNAQKGGAKVKVQSSELDSESYSYNVSDSDVVTNVSTSEFQNINLLEGKPTYIKTHDTKYGDYTFFEGIYNVLHENEYIPKSLSMNNFYGDMKVDVVIDENVSESIIKNVCKKIKVTHDYDGKIVTALNGLNIMILERDCDDEILIEIYNKKHSKNTVVLYKDNGYHPLYNDKMKSIYGNKSSMIDDLKKL